MGRSVNELHFIAVVLLITIVRDRWFDLRALVPLVERSDANNRCISVKSALPHAVVIVRALSGSRCFLVPRPHTLVIIARADARQKLDVVLAALFKNARPIGHRRAKREAICREIRINGIKARSSGFSNVLVLDQQRNDV